MLDSLSDLLSRSGLCPLHDGAGRELGDTVVLWCLGQETSTEGRDDGDKRQAVILMNEDAESVGENLFVNS